MSGKVFNKIAFYFIILYYHFIFFLDRLMLDRESSRATRSNYVQRALFGQFSCGFKALQAKEQVLMQKLTQVEVQQHQYLTWMRI